MREPFQVLVEEVFNISGRGIAVLGRHTGGVIESGDSAVLRQGSLEIDVPEVVVEITSSSWQGRLAATRRWAGRRGGRGNADRVRPVRARRKNSGQGTHHAEPDVSGQATPAATG